MNKPSDTHAAQSVPLWIDGKHVVTTSSRAGDITNPATGRVTKRVPFCNAADIDADGTFSEGLARTCCRTQARPETSTTAPLPES